MAKTNGDRASLNKDAEVGTKMRLEIDTDELVQGIWARLRLQIETVKVQSAPALLSRQDAARYLGISVRKFDDLEIPRVVITDRCVRYRREDLDRFAQERLQA